MVGDGRSAAQRCLQLQEISLQIASYLVEPDELYNACRCNRLWYDALIPLRSSFPHVQLGHAQSFLEFLKNNKRAARHCRGLRILADDNEEMDVDEDRRIDAGVRNSAFIRAIFDLLAEKGNLEFFMYALPGEPHARFTEDVWLSLSRSSPTLQSIYAEIAHEHWTFFLNSTFENLSYLRVFLDSDALPDSNAGSTDFKALLVGFLQRHSKIEVLHLYLGIHFTDFDFTNVRLPALHSLLLISKAPGTRLAPFLQNHPRIECLDVYADTDIEPFAPDALPALNTLQVSALTARWFSQILEAAGQDATPFTFTAKSLLPIPSPAIDETPQPTQNDIAAGPQLRPRRAPLRHLQVTAADENAYIEIERTIAPIGGALRCLELIFWSRDVHLLRVCADAQALFPQLRELSVFIPSWSANAESQNQRFALSDYLICFTGNTTLLALPMSDPVASFIDVEDIEAVAEEGHIPPGLRYIIWRSQAFRISRCANFVPQTASASITDASSPGDSKADDVEDETNMHRCDSELPCTNGIRVERTYHPRTLRGSRYLRDWHEEMVYDHTREDYDL